MQDLVVDKREFCIEHPRIFANPIPIRYVAQKPHVQLVSIFLDQPGEPWEFEEQDFLLPIPWVIYEWAYVPSIAPGYPWFLNMMYFSPVSLDESMHVSTPCLPNFYDTVPCCGETSLCQKEFEDPTFINDFWGESFNDDGDLLRSGGRSHPVWAYLAEKAGCPNPDSNEEIFKVFSYWESLSLSEVASLDWPQNLLIPKCSDRL